MKGTTLINMKTRKRTLIPGTLLKCDFCDEPEELLFAMTPSATRICKACVESAVKQIKG